MKKIIFFVLIFFNISINFVTYGFERWSDYNLNGHENRQYYGEIIYSEKSREVKMRQDDEYYYFDIVQDIVGPFSDNNYLSTRHDSGRRSYTTFENGSKMEIVLAPFSDICHLSHNVITDDNSWSEVSGFNKGNQICYVYADMGTIYSPKRRYYVVRNNSIGTYTSNGRSYPMCYYISGAIRGQQGFTDYVERNGVGGPSTRSGYIQYYIPKLHDEDENIPLTMPQVLSKSCQCVSYRDQSSPNTHFYYVKGVEDIFRYTIKIKKDNLDVWDETGYNISPFRYCNVVSTGTFDAADGSHIFPYSTSINNSIDLSLYIECEHTWEYKDNTTKDYHMRYCSKCQWEKKEPHNYEYDYDNISQNRCICGINKNVYITIKDNIGKINKKFLATPSDILCNIKIEDVGYDFLYVEDKELCYRNTEESEYVVSTISTIPKIVPNNSNQYNIIYYTHKYKINYNTKNNYNLDILDAMNSKIVRYGEKTNLDKTLYQKTGYTFEGWAVEPDLNTAILEDENEIYNISDIDGYEFNLYPVYNPYRYIIRFTSGRGEGYMEDQVCTYGVCENIKGYGYKLDDEAVFLGWRYKGVDIKPNVTTTIEPYVKYNNDVITLQTHIYVRERNEKAGYENSPSKKPGNGRINTDVGPGVKKEEPIVIDDNKYYIENIVRDDDKNKDKNEKDKENENDDKYYNMYIMVASASSINHKLSGDIWENWLLRGVFLAINIIGKMAFCMILVILWVIIILIVYEKRRVANKNKN